MNPYTLTESKPVFSANIEKDGRTTTRGPEKGLLGHKIKRAGARPDGVFVEWEWVNGRLTVRNDRYGCYPFYYYADDREVIISPSIINVIQHGSSAEIDWTALAVFLRIGFFIGDDTPFRSIKALPPDCRFTWENGNVQISGSYTCSEHTDHKDFDKVLDNYIDLFRQSIRRRLPGNGKSAVPLSGGRDSRHILLELVHQGHPPDMCITTKFYPPRHDEDVRIAPLLTKELNIEHIIIDQPKSYFRTLHRRNIETNFCSDEILESAAIADRLDGQVSVLYDGIAGDILSAGLGLDPEKIMFYKEGRFNELADRFLTDYAADCMHEDAFAHLFPPVIRKKLDRGIAMECLKTEFQKHAGTPNPLAQFFFWNRTRREICQSPFGVWSRFPAVYAPYLDYDLYNFLSGLDSNFILSNDFHTETILRAYPQYASVPFASKLCRPKNPNRLRRRYAADLLFSCVRQHKISNKIINMSYVLSRIVNHIIKQNNWWICPPLIHYIIDLCYIVNKAENTALLRDKEKHL